MYKKGILIFIVCLIIITLCFFNLDTQSDNKDKTIYLTFDDGPSLITEKILDLLKEENIKATFFVIGSDHKYDYLIKRAYNEGHTIGLHSYSHSYKQIYKSLDDYFYDLNKLQNKVYNLTGHYSNIIRFPGGSSNTICNRYSKGLMKKIINEFELMDYVYFDWNISSNDTKRISSNRIYKRVISEFKKYDINIVLMHDFAYNYKTLNALPMIIKYGKVNGFKFDKITINTPRVRHKIR